MTKRKVALGAAIFMSAICLLNPVRHIAAQAYTKMFSVWIQSSLIDSTPIGSNSASTVSSTGGTISGSSLVSDGMTLSTINSTTIGSITPAAGYFTAIYGPLTGSLSGNVVGSLTGSVASSTINSSTIGATTPSTGAFTTLSANAGITGNLTGNVAGALNGSVGATSPNTGVFSTLGLTSSAAAACAAYSSTSTTGCTVNVDGKITQWATSSSLSANFAGSVTVTWPITFPSACYNAVPTISISGAPSGNGQGYGSYLESCSTTGANVYADVGADSVGSVAHTIIVTAVGK